MAQLSEHELKTLDYFRRCESYKPSDVLMRYRRNIILIGALVLYLYAAGIKIQTFSGGFIAGTVERHYVTLAFVQFFFLYNAYMFETHFLKEFGLHIFRISSLQSFAISIAKHLIQKEMARFVNVMPSEEYEPKNFSVSRSDEKNVEVQFTLDPEVRATHKEEIEAMPGFTLETHVIKFNYELSEKDEEFYRANKVLLMQLFKQEYMELVFPRHFALFIMMVILAVSTSKIMQV